jgi:hypothetical protein
MAEKSIETLKDDARKKAKRAPTARIMVKIKAWNELLCFI